MAMSAGTAMGLLALDISGFTGGLSTALSAANSAFSSMEATAGQKVTAMGAKMATIGSLLTNTVTDKVVSAGKNIFDVGSTFESTMSKVVAVTNDGSKSTTQLRKDTEDLKNEALRLGSSSFFSAQEVADGMVLMGKAGWSTSDIIDGMGGVIAAAGASGEDLNTVSEVLVDTLTAFGLSASHAGDVADLFAQSANAGTLDIIDLGQSMKYAGPVASALGMSLVDTTAAITMMSTAGIKGSQAGTALRRILLNMVNPTDKQAAAMERLGVSIEDGNGGFKSLEQVLRDVRAGVKSFGNDTVGAQKALQQLAGAYGISGLNAIVNLSEKEFDEYINKMRMSGGVAENTARIMRDNVAGAWDEFKDKLVTAKVKIFDSIAPTLKKLLDSLNNFMENLNGKITPEVGRFIVVLGGVAAAIGPVLKAVGTLTMGLGGLMQRFESAGDKAQGFSSKLSGAFSKMPAEVAAAAASADVIPETVGAAFDKTTGLARKSGNVAGASFSEGVSNVLSTSSPSKQWIDKATEDSIKGTRKYADSMLKEYHRVRTEARKSGSEFGNEDVALYRQLARKGIDAYRDSITPGINSMASDLSSKFGSTMTNGFNSQIKQMETPLSRLKIGFSSLTSSFSSDFKGVTDSINGGIKNIKISELSKGFGQTTESLNLMKGGVTDIATSFGTKLSPAISGVSKGIGMVGNVLKVALGAGAVAIVVAIVAAFANLMMRANDTATMIKLCFESIGENLMKFFTIAGQYLAPVGDMFKNTFEQFANNVAPIFITILQTLVQATSNMSSGMAGPLEAIKTLLEGLHGVFEDLLGAATDAFQGISLLIQGDTQGAIDSFKSAIEGILDTFTHLTDVIGDFVGGALHGLADGFREAGLDGIADLLDAIGNGFDKLGEVVEFCKERIVQLFERLQPVIQRVVEQVTQAWNKISQVLAPIIQFLGAVLVPAFETAFSLVATIVGAAAAAIGGIISGLAQVFGGIAQYISGIVNAIGGTFRVLWGIIQIVVGAIVGLITGDWSMAMNGMKDVTEGAGDAMNGIFEALGGAFEVLGGIFEAVGSVIGGVIEAVVGGITDLANGVGGVIEGIAGFFGLGGDAAEKMADQTQEANQRAGDSYTEFAEKAGAAYDADMAKKKEEEAAQKELQENFEATLNGLVGETKEKLPEVTAEFANMSKGVINSYGEMGASVVDENGKVVISHEQMMNSLSDETGAASAAIVQAMMLMSGNIVDANGNVIKSCAELKGEITAGMQEAESATGEKSDGMKSKLDELMSKFGETGDSAGDMSSDLSQILGDSSMDLSQFATGVQGDTGVASASFEEMGAALDGFGQKSSAAATSVSDAFRSVSDSINGSIEGARGTLDTFTTDLGGKFDALKLSIDNFKTSVSESFTQLKTDVELFRTSSTEAINGFGAEALNAMNILVSSISTTFGTFATTITMAFDSCNAALMAWASNLMVQGQTAALTFVSAFTLEIGNLPLVVSEPLNATLTVFSSFSEQVGMQFTGLSEIISGHLSMALTYVSEWAAQVVEAGSMVGTEFSSAVSESFSGAYQSIQQNLSDASASVRSFDAETRTVISGMCRTISTDIKTSFRSMYNEVRSELQNMRSTTQSVTSAMKQTISSMTREASNTISSNFRNMSASVSAATGEMQRNISTFSSQAVASVQNATNGMRQSFETSFTSVAATVQSRLSSMTQQVAQFASRLSVAGRLAGTNFSTGLNSALARATQAINTHKGNWTRAITSFATSMTSYGSSAGRNFSSAITNALSGLYSQLYSAGQYAAQGLANGISSGAGSVAAAAASMAQAAVSAARANLKIQSPSKVFDREVGQYIPLGMVQGIETTQGKVFESVTNLSKTVAELAKGGIRNVDGVIESETKTLSNNIKSFLTKQQESMSRWFKNYLNDRQREIERRIDQLETARDNQIKVLDDEADFLKKEYDKQADLAKNAYDMQIASAKKNYEAQTKEAQKFYDDKIKELNKLKDADKDWLNDQKQFYKDQLEQQKEAYKQQHEELTNSIKNNYEAQKEADKAAYEAKKEAIDKHKEHIKEVTAAAVDEQKAMKTYLTGEVKTIVNDWLGEYGDALEEVVNGTVEEFTESLNDVTEAYSKAMDEVDKKMESLQSKMTSYGGLFTKEKVKDVETFTLNSLQEQTKAINKYGDNLEALKNVVPDALMSEILAMDLEDATKYTNMLLAMNQETFDAYIVQYNAKQEAAERIAKNFYKQQVDILNEGYAKELEALAKRTADNCMTIIQQTIPSLTEAFKDVGLDVGEEGLEIYNALFSGFSRYTTNLFKTGDPLIDWDFYEREAGEGMSNYFGRLLEEIEKNGRPVNEAIQKMLTYEDWTAEQVRETIEKFPEIFTGKNLRAMQDYINLMHTGFDREFRLVQGIKNVVLDGSEVVGNFVSGVIDGAGKFVGDAANVLLGLITPQKHALRNGGMEVAEEFVGAVEDKLQINSPSKVMEQVGSFAADGFIEGVSKMGDFTEELMDTVEHNVNHLVDSVRAMLNAFLNFTISIANRIGVTADRVTTKYNQMAAAARAAAAAAREQAAAANAAAAAARSLASANAAAAASSSGSGSPSGSGSVHALSTQGSNVSVVINSPVKVSAVEAVSVARREMRAMSEGF